MSYVHSSSARLYTPLKVQTTRHCIVTCTSLFQPYLQLQPYRNMPPTGEPPRIAACSVCLIVGAENQMPPPPPP